MSGRRQLKKDDEQRYSIIAAKGRPQRRCRKRPLPPNPQPAAASSETIISCQLRIGDALAVTSSEESVRTQRYEELRPPHYTSS
ncbi:hypothetical protein QR680_012197 [Steinernema hermaphroditum]|uniref:Uncharacterized protein n=1 Tax=Steinernema hermaphroditum TaxID=289476 RepID=A0AA39I3Z4_9BILA|nr:hypothetical protein QR680_012197 [Steinernema hermaphroditum]